MAKFLRIIEKTNEFIGKTIRWVILGMIFSTTYEVFARYFFNSPTQWAHQTVMQLGGVLVTLSWAWVLLHRGHIGLDVIYLRLSARKQAIINIAGYLVLFFPLIGMLTYVSIDWMVDSWVTGERWTVSFWRTPMGPSRTVIVIGFIMLFLQGLSNFIHDFSALRAPKGDLT